jgi:hypothetical protein
MNSLSSVHSHGFHKSVTVVSQTQPTVTGGILKGLYNFNTTTTAVPTISNGVTPVWAAGAGSISTTTFKNGTGALSTSISNNLDNQLYLGAYTMTTNNQLSIAFWLYPVRTSLSGNPGVFILSTSQTNGVGYFLIIQNVNNNATNNVRYAVMANGAISTDTSITGNQWTHCCMVYNGQTCSTYLNGTLIQTANFANAIPAATTFHATLCSDTAVSGATQRSTLFIDEFRIYDGLLSPTDVSNIYNWTS